MTLDAFGLGPDRIRLITADEDTQTEAIATLSSFTERLETSPIQWDGKPMPYWGNREVITETIRAFIENTGKEPGCRNFDSPYPFAFADVEESGCTMCRSCVNVCPVHAFRIEESSMSLQFNHLACVACGLTALIADRMKWSRGSRFKGIGETVGTLSLVDIAAIILEAGWIYVLLSAFAAGTLGQKLAYQFLTSGALWLWFWWGFVAVGLALPILASVAEMVYKVGRGPHILNKADLNKDDVPDLVVGSLGPHTLSVLIGHGDGTFRQPIEVSVGRFPHYRAFGDWNGDGHTDVAVAAAGEDAVDILVGDGTGNLKKTTGYPVGSNPHGLDAGDFNGDGHLDLAVSNRSSRDLHILLADGAGKFLSSPPIPTGQDIIALAVGDFDEDKRLDLALVSATSHSVIILKGDGRGNFKPFSTQEAGRQRQ